MISMVQPRVWFQKRNALLSASLLAFISNMLSNAANYGTQVYLGRLLGPADYGSYNALMAVLMLLGIPIAALSFLIARQVAHDKAAGQIQLVSLFYRQGFFRLIGFGFILISICILTLPFVREFLHINNIYAIAWLGPIALFALFQPFNMAFSQGLHDFRWVAINNATMGPIRFVACVSLVWIGWGINGAMFANFIAVFFGWLLSSIPLKNIWRISRSVQGRVKSMQWSDIIPVFISTISFFVLTQCDVIMVKHLFSAQVSGFYASASLLGKAVLYVPGAVVIGLVPMVAGKTTPNEAWQLFKKALLMTAMLSGTGAVILWFIPEWVLCTFFGSEYLPAASLLKYFGLSMLPMAFILVIKAYFIAKKANEFSYVMLCGSLAMITTIVYFAKTPMDVLIWIGAFGGTVALIGFILEYIHLLRYKLLQGVNQ